MIYTWLPNNGMYVGFSTNFSYVFSNNGQWIKMVTIKKD